MTNLWQRYRFTTGNQLDRLIPEHHQHEGQAFVYFLVHCLLEFMVWLHNHIILKNSYNVQEPIEVVVFWLKNVLQQS